MLLLILACAAKKPPEPTQPEGPKVGVVQGPWLTGSRVALASTGPRDLQGGWAGPSIVIAAWQQGDELWTSSTMSAGRGWTPPLLIDRGLETDEEGQARAALGIAMGRPVAAYSSGGVPRIAERSGEGWEARPVSEEARGERVELAVLDGEPVVLWLDSARGGVWILMNGVEEQVSDQSTMDCVRPALSVEGAARVAFRDAEGSVWHMRRSEEGWGVVETLPGRPVCDGPAFGGERLLQAEDGVLYAGGVEVLAVEEGWGIDAPRAAGGLLAWREQSGDRDRVVLGGQSLLTREGSVVLGDPVVVAGDLWLPFDGDAPVVATFSQETLER